MPLPTNEFSIFDNQELVTYTPSGGSPVNAIRAVRRPLTQSRQRNVERYVELEPTDVVFHLDAAPLASAALAVGDTLTDSGGVAHEVMFVERQTLNMAVAVIGRPPAA